MKIILTIIIIFILGCSDISKPIDKDNVGIIIVPKCDSAYQGGVLVYNCPDIKPVKPIEK